MKLSEFTYTYNNKDYVVHVKHAHQRNIYYRYKDDGFYVSAPYLAGKSTITKGLDKFAEKLIKQYTSSHSNYSFIEDFVYLLGERVSLKSLNIKNLQDLAMFLKEKAQIFISSLVKKHEEIMQISEPYKVVVRSTVRQFGSNSKRTHTLSFQIDLIHYSEEIIETVVIHELAHEFERNHSKNFYNIVYKYCPRYKQLQKKLKKGIHK